MRFFKYLRRYSEQYLNNTFNRNKLQFLIFFVTSRCNCRCGICFNWKGLNQPEELSLEEIEKISRSLGDIHTVLFSGGEPFLRKDLLEISRLFIKQNKISILSVPTNGSLAREAVEFSEKLLQEFPQLTLSIAVSLDGLKETHDKMRGVEGAFDKASGTLKKLLELKGRYKNLEVVVNTVITNINIPELALLADFVYDNFNSLDAHEFELLRGEYQDEKYCLPAPDKLKIIHRLITENTQRYLKRKRTNILERFSVIGLLLFTHKAQERCLAKGKGYFACSAGRNIGVIEANGNVKLCELLPAVGNLKKVNYEFPLAWNSPEANELRKKIAQSCNCTHICFIKLSSSSYIRTLFYIAYYYLLYKIKRYE